MLESTDSYIIISLLLLLLLLLLLEYSLFMFN